MKKVFLLMMSCLMLITHAKAKCPVEFSVQIIDKDAIGNSMPKAPLAPPTVYIEDYVLSFAVGHPDYVLSIKDEDGNEVYATSVFSSETDVTLPSSLSGDYCIELICGNWKFTGYITL